MKHLPTYTATEKGHMNQIRKNIKSTKTQRTQPNKGKPMETLEILSNHVFTKIIHPKQWIATNLTGIFPDTSNRGKKYLFILYDYDINCILVRPMKNRTKKKFINVFQDIHGLLTTRGLKPNYMQLDNDKSPEF